MSASIGGNLEFNGAELKNIGSKVIQADLVKVGTMLSENSNC